MKCKIFKKRYLIPLCAVLIGSIILAAVWISSALAQKKQDEMNREAYRNFYNSKLEQFSSENPNYSEYEVDVAFIGDSLTEGYDLQANYPQYVTLNRGIGGDKTYELLKRLKVSLYDLKPKVVVLLIGANNMSTMLQDYETILQELKQNLPQTKVVILSLTAMGGEHWGPKNQLAAYNNVYIKILAKKYGYEFVDIYSVLFDVSIGEIYKSYTIDGGHLTPLGYSKITEQVTPVLKELLGR